MTIPILTYHSIDQSGSVISIAPAQFEKQIAYFRRKSYRTITLSDMVRRVQSGTDDAARTIVITFDDGFKNNAEVAGHILEKYGFTATIFVATDHVGLTCGWEKEGPISKLPLMTWEEIRQMHGRGFDIQPHSCSHPFLTKLTDEQAWSEIAGSKQEIEAKLNKACDVFCYPYGDFDDRIVELVKRAGFLAAATIEFGHNYSPADLYRLKRLGSTHFARSTVRLRASLAGIYETYLGAKRWLSRMP